MRPGPQGQVAVQHLPLNHMGTQKRIGMRLLQKIGLLMQSSQIKEHTHSVECYGSCGLCRWVESDRRARRLDSFEPNATHSLQKPLLGTVLAKQQDNRLPSQNLPSGADPSWEHSPWIHPHRLQELYGKPKYYVRVSDAMLGWIHTFKSRFPNLK